MYKCMIKINMYYICLLIILQLNGLWYYIDPYSTIFEVSIVFEVILIFILSIKSYIRDIKKITIYLIGFGMFFSLLVISYHNYIILMFDLLIIIIFVRYAYIKKINILHYTSNIIIGLALISIVFYIVFSILKLGNPTNTYAPFNNNVIYTSFYDIYFTSQKTIVNGVEIIRNGSIFTEPGAFALYLNFSFVYETIIDKRCISIKKIILALAILTTTSAFGYCILFAFICVNFILKFNKLKNYKKVLYSVVIISLIGICSYLSYKVYYNKMNSGGVSGIVRKDDARIGLLLFKEKMMFGWGYGNWNPVTYMQDSILRRGDIGGHSNGAVNIIYCGGIYLAVYYVANLYRFTLKFLRYNKRMIFLSLYLIVQLVVFPIQFSYFMYLFLILGSLEFKIDDSISNIQGRNS